MKEGGGDQSVDIIHGNFVKIFMQKLSTSLITNIKEAQTSALPKQSELLLHNDQIYGDIKTTITSFLFNVLFTYSTFNTTQSGGFNEAAFAVGQAMLGVDAMSNAMMSQRKAKEKKVKQTSMTQSNLPENQVDNKKKLKNRRARRAT